MASMEALEYYCSTHKSWGELYSDHTHTNAPGVSVQLWKPFLCHVSVLQKLVGVVLSGEVGDQARMLLALLTTLLRKQVKQLEEKNAILACLGIEYHV